jgi:hypothetical protein
MLLILDRLLNVVPKMTAPSLLLLIKVTPDKEIKMGSRMSRQLLRLLMAFRLVANAAVGNVAIERRLWGMMG